MLSVVPPGKVGIEFEVPLPCKLSLLHGQVDAVVLEGVGPELPRPHLVQKPEVNCLCPFSLLSCNLGLVLPSELGCRQEMQIFSNQKASLHTSFVRDVGSYA